MKVFVLSTSYYENLVVRLINLVSSTCSEPVTIYLLRENHFLDEFVVNKFSFSVVMVDTINEAINSCDVVLFLKTENQSQELISQIKYYTKKEGKKVKYIDLTDIPCNMDVDLSDKYNCFPTILLVSIGAFSQVSVHELAISRLLYDSGIAVKNCWSNITNYVYHELVMTNVFYDMLCNKEEYNVILKTIEVKSILDILNNEALIYQINEIKPDYVVVISEEYCNGFDQIDNIFKYRFGCIINQKFISDYFPVLWDSNIIGVKSSKQLSILELFYDKDLKNILSQDILSNISFSEGIVPII